MSIRLSALTRRFGHTVVVDRLSLDIPTGELFVLLGGSGSGKSTVLRMIAGLISPDAGTVAIGGRDVTGLAPQLRHTGFVFQNYSLFRHMTVSENIEFGLRIRRAPATRRTQRREELLDLVGLAGFGHRYPHELSGGQQQRVALARALACEPQVLLLDEPFGALDVKIRAQLRESLQEIQRQLRITTVLVTHDQHEAFELADRIGIIERGHLIEVGTPRRLYTSPESEFTAAFIGGGNVVVGRMEGGNIRLGSSLVPLPANAPPHDEGAPVRILFRPESVIVRTAPDPALVPLGVGRPVRTIFSGSHHRVRFELDDLRGVRVIAPPPGYGYRSAQIEALLPAGEELQSGETRWLGLTEFHVLAPAGLRVLVAGDADSRHAGALFANQIVGRRRGSARLLHVHSPTAAGEPPLDALRELRERFDAGTPVDTRIRTGDTLREILIEAQEGDFELVVVGPPYALRAPRPRLGRTVRALLEQSRVPVAIVSTTPPPLRRILLCTAAGEPGKADVRFGARVARQNGAVVTLFHALRPGAGADERSRADRHLSQATDLLTALGVAAETICCEGPVRGSILGRLAGGEFDLVVIGAPLEEAGHDLPIELIKRSNRPVLIIPPPGPRG